MFFQHEGEAIKEAIESLKDEAQRLLDEARIIESAWKHGDRAELQRMGILKPFKCVACGREGDAAIASTGSDNEGDFVICKCGQGRN